MTKATLYPVVLGKVKEYIIYNLKDYDFSFSDKVKIENENRQLINSKAEIFEALLEKRISEEQFRSANGKISDEISENKNKLKSCRKAAALKSKCGSERLIDILNRLLASRELTKEHMMFVKRINVFDKEHFEIILETESALTVLCRNIDFYEEVLK